MLIFALLVFFSLSYTTSVAQELTSQGSLFEEMKEIIDPWEVVNRKIFSLNIFADKYAFYPLSKAYTVVTPKWCKNRLDYFVYNLSETQNALALAISGQIEEAFTAIWRFFINSTIGLAGMFDIASSLGMQSVSMDISTALENLGVKSGPYIVLPVLGPSSIRNIIAYTLSLFVNPISYTNSLVINFTLSVVKLIVLRSRNIDVNFSNDKSLDLYSKSRSIFSQKNRLLTNA